MGQIDAGSLQRVWHNLLSNAVKFTEEGTVSLQMTVAETEDQEASGREILKGETSEERRPTATATDLEAAPLQIRFEISDTGPGIDLDFQDCMFEEFTQESDGLDRTHEGAGLGLSVVLRLVQLLNGTLSVQSEPGEGSTFTVEIPAHRAHPDHDGGRTGVPEAASSPARGGGEPLRLLIVDDRPEVGLIVAEFLSDCEVTAATSLAEVEDALATHPVDLCLVDIHLGEGLSGDTVRDSIQAITDPAPPIAALTAHSMPEDRDRFLKAGLDGYIAKPFSRQSLRRDIAALLHADPV